MEFIATLKHEVFRNKDWAVQKWKTEDGENITVTGESLPTTKGTSYVLVGEFVTSGKYADSFKCISASKHRGKNKEEIINFLSSLKGFGPKTAKKVFDEFGENTYEIIEKEPEKLAAINGISAAKAQKLHKSFIDDEKKMAFFKFIVPLGIEQTKANSFANMFKADSRTPIDIVKENPYLLTRVHGIDFFDADIVAKKIGFNMKSRERVLSACYCILRKRQSNGDLGMNFDSFKKEFHRYLQDTYSINGCNKMADVLIRDGYFVGSVDTNGEYSIFTNYAYDTEYSIAESVVRLLNAPSKRIKIGDLSPILDLDQIDAVKMGLSNNISIITGGPGTGKTTILIEIIKQYTKSRNSNVVLMAPTGRAAAKMKETTGIDASTIHSRLKIYDEEEETRELIEDSLVIVDEFSMVDSSLAKNLFSAIASSCIVVLCGDANQLPSVGAGAVLLDMLNSNRIPSKKLTIVHRQDEMSTLYENIKATKNEEKAVEEIIEDDSFRFVENFSKDDVISAVMSELNGTSFDDLQKVMCLAPFKKNEIGVFAFNEDLKNIINPMGETFKFNGKLYSVGDYIMNLKNNEVAANGDVGIITGYDYCEKEIEVFINGQKAILTEDDDIMHAYSSTVHKAQGSEAETVILVLPESNLLTNNLVYTAITRAKSKVIVFSTKQNYINAAKRKVSGKRVTVLENLLVEKIRSKSA